MPHPAFIGDFGAVGSAHVRLIDDLPNQAQIAGSYGFQLFGLNAAADSKWDVIILGVVFIFDAISSTLRGSPDATLNAPVTSGGASSADTFARATSRTWTKSRR